jgi:A/G-specific adenine glycosylase
MNTTSGAVVLRPPGRLRPASEAQSSPPEESFVTPFGTDASPAAAARDLLAWYDCRRRDLPWRSPPGVRADPYRVWISEIMLQQTTVTAVAPYFEAFLARWPSIQDLAAAEVDEVLHAWQGLGYYARARNLYACARMVAARAAGLFPQDESALRLLPGVGAYTAAAIAAIAFDRPATPIDGNVLRVVARLHAVKEALPAARSKIEALARTLTPERRAGDFAQAMMDLGATLCTPRRPRCPDCPWRNRCAALKAGAPEDYPRRTAKAEKPVRRGVVFWAEREDGAVLVRRRPSRGLLGGMMEFPSTPWRAAAWPGDEAQDLAPAAALWSWLQGVVHHTFTHFQLELAVLAGSVRDGAKAVDDSGCSWCLPRDFALLALPTLMKKVTRLALSARTQPSLTLTLAPCDSEGGAPARRGYAS